MNQIRNATKDDAKQLSQLQEKTFRDTFGAHNSIADMDMHCLTSYSLALQEQEINNPSMITLVSEGQGQLTGFVQLCWRSSSALCEPDGPPKPTKSLEIQRLYVDKNWHGTGLGQELMQRSISTATDLAASQLWLGVWENNPRAISFYKKFDFTEVGEHVFMVGSDPQRDIIMTRLL